MKLRTDVRTVLLVTTALLAGCAARDPASGPGAWRFASARAAPWVSDENAPLDNAGLRGTTIRFGADRVDASPPLGCAGASYEFVVTPAAGLFQGVLPEPARPVALTMGIVRLPVLTMRAQCDTGVFDYHRIGADSLLFALDNVIWRLASEPSPATPAQTVIALLAEHMTADMGFSAEGIESKQRFLSATLSALIVSFLAQPWPDDEPPPINGDPFTGSQEYPQRFVLDSVRLAGGTAAVGIIFDDGYRWRPVTAVLRHFGRRWLLDDVKYEDGTSFRELLQSGR